MLRIIATACIAALVTAGCGGSQSTTTVVVIKTKGSSFHETRKQLCSHHIRRAPVSSNIPGGPWKHNVEATTFYIGEPADSEDSQITNQVTAWDDYAVQDFGGVDGNAANPPLYYERPRLCPRGFIPKQNPFYLALPIDDHPWAQFHELAAPWIVKAAQFLPELRKFPGGSYTDAQAPFKNLWVEVTHNGRSAFGQIEDTGPSNKTGVAMADFAFVFGSHPNPKNTSGLMPGIDLSPALTTYLGTDGDAKVSFRFVSAKSVPLGPWKVIVTTSPPHWK